MDKNRIQDRAASVAGDIESAVGTFAGDAKAQMEELASQTTTTAERAYGEARRQMRGAAAAATNSVQQQPLGTLLAVGLVCGAVGFLLARR
jgi:uncharacterized protein YjbJ (UPF0337 family)